MADYASLENKRAEVIPVWRMLGDPMKTGAWLHDPERSDGPRPVFRRTVYCSLDHSWSFIRIRGTESVGRVE